LEQIVPCQVGTADLLMVDPAAAKKILAPSGIAKFWPFVIAGSFSLLKGKVVRQSSSCEGQARAANL
jgi:hypothetical protein